MSGLVRYRNFVFDSSRWDDFPFRRGDIVISTPPKCGTTWMQTLCAMLIFDATSFDLPLAEHSPWLDMQTNRRSDIVARLEAQQHRRFIKTHTPLDGVPITEGVTYVCVARDPRDVALSFQHHWANLDKAAFLEARAEAVGLDDLAELGPPPDLPDDPLERFWLWVDAEPGTFVGPALVDVLHHVQTFWDHRCDEHVELFHYSDLLADLPGQLRRLAAALAIDVTDQRIADYAAAASFEAMRRRAADLVPDVGNRIWLSNEAFFHHGTDGQWRHLLAVGDLDHYHGRVSALLPPDAATWVHSGWLGTVAAEPTVA